MKRTLKTIVITLLLLVNLSAVAQSVKINGTVVDNNNQPVEFVNVAVVSLPDSSMVAGTTTNSKGKFNLKADSGNDLLLKISFIGYTSRQIEVKNPHGDIRMGDIILSEQSVALNEVVVSGSNITQKIDRMVIMPTEAAVKSSYNPYDLMSNLAIPHLQVNSITKSLDVNGGAVQTRINGIVATATEVAAILPKDVVRIEFIENPGMRYGDSSLGAVIDIIVRRNETGGLVNIQTTNSPHMLLGENNVVAKYNYKKSQWGVFYNLVDRGFRKSHTDTEEEYFLKDETIRRVQEGINDRNKHFEHNLDLSYNLSDPDKYMFNVTFRNGIYDAPHLDKSSKLYNAGDPDNFIFSKLRNKEFNYTPSLDLYYQRSLPHAQTLTVNATGTLIDSRSDRNYSEFTTTDENIATIETNVNGKKRSIIGEAIYDKRFKSIMLTAGLRHYQMYAKNEYSGSSPVTSEMNQAKSSAFAEIQGSIKKVGYGISAGITRSYFEEEGQKHTYYTFTPTVRLNFAPHKNGNINYRFNTEPRIPSLSSLTDVEQAIDTIQIVRGNPNLKTFNVYNNTLNYSYTKGHFLFMMNVNHSYQKNCIMESVFAEGNKLILMDENQRSYQALNFGPTIVFRALNIGKLKNFLTLSMEGGFARYWSNGNNYTHTYNNFYYNIVAMLNYKEFALLGQFSKNKNTLFGETIYKGENQTAIMATYTHKRIQLGVGMMFPFTNNFKTGKERISKVAPYSSWNYIKEAGQMVAIRINYNFEFGKSYKSANKRTNNNDKESGILNVNR